MALTVEAVRVDRVLLHMKILSDFDYFYSRGLTKAVGEYSKRARAEIGLMTGFDFGLLATSNRLGQPGDRGGS